jgi:hypothetical protein
LLSNYNFEETNVDSNENVGLNFKFFNAP